MAHHVLGIDLGSHAVKVIIAQPGLRQSTPLDYIERPIPAGDEPHEIRAARVLGQIMRERKLDTDAAYVAAPGDRLFIHVLDFPFETTKRHVLESAVGAELENVLPVDLEDMVFTFERLPEGAPEPTPAPPDSGSSGSSASVDDEPTEVRGPPRPNVVRGRVAPPIEGMRLLTCAMETARARDVIGALGANAVEPRALVAAPAAYARVVERLPWLDRPSTTSGRGGSLGAPVAIIDIGHERTDVCIIQGGRAMYARTIKRGGLHLTEVLSRAWSVSLEEAERAKREYGFLASSMNPAGTREQERVHEVIQSEVGPLVKDIQRTLASCLAKTGVAASQVVLLGGGSRLRGLDGFMSDVLRVPVHTLDASAANDLLGPKLASMGVRPDTAALAVGMALEGGTGRPRFDLRQGELAYKADLSFLRQKAGVLAAVVVAVVGFAVVNGFAAHYKLRKAHDALSQRLAVETTEAFGDPLSAAATLAQTGGAVDTSKKSPLPRKTAYDLLIDINSNLPPSDKVTLDVRELDIKPGKILIKAGVKAPPEIDDIEEQLKKISCFKVSRGDTSVGADGVHEFSFTINSNCM